MSCLPFQILYVSIIFIVLLKLIKKLLLLLLLLFNCDFWFFTFCHKTTVLVLKLFDTVVYIIKCFVCGCLTITHDLLVCVAFIVHAAHVLKSQTLQFLQNVFFCYIPFNCHSVMYYVNVLCYVLCK